MARKRFSSNRARCGGGAVLIEDCIVVAAIEEERLNPTKHPNKAATRQLGDNESRESEEECSFGLTVTIHGLLVN
jgi:predicted outer membrane repeat protein